MSSQRPDMAMNVKGWRSVGDNLVTFVEAPLELSREYSTADPSQSSVLLVSAPGAVGKSALARQIGFRTGAVLVDLAEAEPVGGNTLVGGLARSGLYESFKSGRTALLIDGLDEARLRVTQESFLAFLRDIADLSSLGGKPLVLLGRTGSVQEAWLGLDDMGIRAPVFEIGFFSDVLAFEFCLKQVQLIRREQFQREPDKRAVRLILDKVRADTGTDKSRFSGYSPVLIAVAKQVADVNDIGSQNTQALISALESGQHELTLSSITDSILAREQTKLRKLKFEDESLKEVLYGPGEQLARLVNCIYGTAQEFRLPGMSVADREVYTNALESWVSDHPFLDGTGSAPSSAVFGGLIAAQALAGVAAPIVLRKELARGTAINPFLAEFYGELVQRGVQGAPNIPAAHVGVIYASIRARLSLGETASLRIDGELNEADEDDDQPAEIEIVRTFREENHIRRIEFITDPSEDIILGSYVEDVDVVAPLSRVSFLPSDEVTLVSPIYIEAHELNFQAKRIVAESAPKNGKGNPEIRSAIFLKAEQESANGLSSRPLIRGDVSLSVSWPRSNEYPWTEFSEPATDLEDPRIEEALRRLKKMLRLFRSHSRNQLAKYRYAIEHRRRTKGAGQAVLEQLIEENVLRLDGPLYYLDPNQLVEKVGLNFHDVRTTRASEATTAFLRRALNDRAG